MVSSPTKQQYRQHMGLQGLKYICVDMKPNTASASVLLLIIVIKAPIPLVCQSLILLICEFYFSIQSQVDLMFKYFFLTADCLSNANSPLPGLGT